MNSELDFDNIEFTFHGDLLGTSNLYQIDKDLAYNKLSSFYNTVWNIFNLISKKFDKSKLNIILFSDSIFITGCKLKITLEHLAKMYWELFKDQIFVRGAIVEGHLDFDPRLELSNLTKNLPKGDVLFRAVTLEKQVKGAHLLIEKQLAKKLLPEKWLTDELYSKNTLNPPYPRADFRRRIILHREWIAYEYLWTWLPDDTEEFLEGFSESAELKSNPEKTLTRISLRVPQIVSSHYEETRELFSMAKQRSKITLHPQT
ncbi:MAG: hypothetical protein OEZ20_06825 [candidate division WOR-3 bacterium]|nr:hypothetical protein [candidate division WOR-3 bacterium]MDH5684158.1 hypothetical protein [candidate division WOR-3 bacterium]